MKMPIMTAQDKSALIFTHHMTAMFDRATADSALLQVIGKALREDAMTPDDAVDLIKAAFDEEADKAIEAETEKLSTEPAEAPSEKSDIAKLLELIDSL